MASTASLPGRPGPPIPPNQTLYVTNLPSSKIAKADLRTALYMLFSTYGPVLDVVALKTMKMRGQAHIVYRDVQTATQAMRSLNGFQFLGRELKISYAKSKSHVISKLDGTFRLVPEGAAAPQKVEVTELQQSIFNAPVPGSAAATQVPKPPPQAGPPAAGPQKAAEPEKAVAADQRGQKRTRDEEEEEEEDSDVAMEEDSDESE